MTTKLVGLKDFRQNLAVYTQEVETKKVRFIVLKKNKPVLEVNPIFGEEFTLESLRKEITGARKQAQRGQVYTLKETRKKLRV